MFTNTLRDFASGSVAAFACALDYRSAARVGITDLAFFESERRKLPESKFAMEYGSIFVGAEANSVFPYDLTETCRSLRTVEYAMPKGSTSDYVMGVDLATSSGAMADNAVITVLKLVEHEDGTYGKRLVYLRSYHGKRLDALADEVRLTYARFSKVVKVVFDHRGLGDAFPEFLSQPWTSPEGKEYPPWVLDDERSIIHNAVPLLRSVKASAQINQQLVSCMRIALEQRSLEVPVNSRHIVDGRVHDGSEDEEDGGKTRTLTAQERAIFLEADALQIEMGNIVMKISASGTYTYDTARVRQHKDRYSALAMAVRYVAELEEGRKRKLTSRGGMCIGVVTRM